MQSLKNLQRKENKGKKKKRTGEKSEIERLTVYAKRSETLLMLLITYMYIYIQTGLHRSLLKGQYGVMFSERFSLVVQFSTTHLHHPSPYPTPEKNTKNQTTTKNPKPTRLIPRLRTRCVGINTILNWTRRYR